ncbi:Transposase DDE domain-containing protein [Methylobacterium sp. 174MFSha1.1]|uniref:IS4 family transposase n=1 Tax=Methylobacterium sp. 174MFSha1.1 TaxID=1502749 RepID=UPI0008E9C1E5|nr:IS4 family transposase [Methylobacterium sp. 174MFSha1.1]SFV06242.1 Transposase DDE domain-containing protein [Methylobacterium sp. 174MFSha1.1]
MRGLGSGDVRTEARGAWLFERIVTTGSVVLSTVGGSEAGTAAAHRYLSSPCTDWQGILQAFAVRTAKACAGRPIVAVQDTSEISFTPAAAGRHGLGPAGNGRNPGLFLHPVIAVDAEDEAVLGLVDAQIWTRSTHPTPPRHRRAVEDKESLRWITGAAAAASTLAETAQSLIVVADQEGDIYSHFARQPAGSDLLVRACHDRALVGGGCLHDTRSWPITATGKVQVPARPGRPARLAAVRLQAGPVEVARPSSLSAREPASLSLHCVCVQETDPPAGVTPLCWRLLTTRAVPDAAAAQEMVRLYRLRWRIEEVFRALKRDGLSLDETQVRVPDKLFRLSALALGAAVRILQLVDARDGGRRPMTDVLDEACLPVVAELGRACEGSTVRLQNPHPAGSLGWLMWIVARHGGWNAPNTPPGPKAVARGWERFSAMLAGALLARDSLPSRP